MVVTMAKTIQEERWRWIKPIITKEMKLVDVARVCPHSVRSLKRWKKAYQEAGMKGLIPKSTKPKTHPNETSIRVKERIIEHRKKTKLCALKIHWQLKKQGLVIPVSTTSKILKDAGLVKKYRSKKIKYKHIKVQREPGELIEIDVKHVPGGIAGKKYYQYTAIDTASRWRHLEIFDQESTFHSIQFLKIVMEKFPHSIKAIKTDNHSTFTNYYIGTNKRSDMTVKKLHGLDVFCAQNNMVHYLIDPGKPTQNGTVERSHGEDNRKFYEPNTFKSVRILKSKLVFGMITIMIWNIAA